MNTMCISTEMYAPKIRGGQNRASCPLQKVGECPLSTHGSTPMIHSVMVCYVPDILHVLCSRILSQAVSVV